ncbi:unnamed protein product [Amoebophrya sp. A25]|nr:unnamed protein product [Amoebophrya sp. A25]|eukprot:GSA25T00004043001.1
MSRSRASSTSTFTMLHPALHLVHLRLFLLSSEFQQVTAQLGKVDKNVENWWYESPASKVACLPDTDYDISYKETGIRVLFPLFLVACLVCAYLIGKEDTRETHDGRVLSRKEIHSDEKLKAKYVDPSVGKAKHKIQDDKWRVRSLHIVKRMNSSADLGLLSRRKSLKAGNIPDPNGDSSTTLATDGAGTPASTTCLAPDEIPVGRGKSGDADDTPIIYDFNKLSTLPEEDQDLPSTASDESSVLDHHESSIHYNEFSFGIGKQLVSTKANMKEIGAVNFEDHGHAKKFLTKRTFSNVSLGGSSTEIEKTPQSSQEGLRSLGAQKAGVVGTKQTKEGAGEDAPVTDLEAQQKGDEAENEDYHADEAEGGNQVDQEKTGLGALTNFYWEFQSRPQKERLYFLDAGRVCCILCVVTEHAGTRDYSGMNVWGALNWVLPFLYLISGWCYVMSHAPLIFYIMRLAALFVVGVFANFIADRINGKDNLFDMDTIFHMFFVVMLAVMSILAYPLRRLMLWRSAHPFGQVNSKVYFILGLYGALTLAATVLYCGGILDTSESENSDSKASRIFATTLYSFADFFGLCFLISLVLTLGTGSGNSWLPWLVVVYVWLLRVFIAFDNVGWLHLLKVYVFGMVMCKFKFRYGDVLKNVILRTYWPFVFIFLVFLQIPTASGRCDTFPRQYWLDRFRWYASECLIVVWFSSGAMNTSDPYAILPILGNWALFAYAFHEFFNRVIPAPYGAFVVIALAPISIFVVFRMYPNRLKRLRARQLGLPPKSAEASSEDEGAGEDVGQKGTGKGAKDKPKKDKIIHDRVLLLDDYGGRGIQGLGLVVQDVSGEITAVQPGGWAAEQGLRVGDYIRNVEAGGRRKEFLPLPQDMRKDILDTRAMMHFERPLSVAVTMLSPSEVKSKVDDKSTRTAATNHTNSTTIKEQEAPPTTSVELTPIDGRDTGPGRTTEEQDWQATPSLRIDEEQGENRI